MALGQFHGRDAEVIEASDVLIRSIGDRDMTGRQSPSLNPQAVKAVDYLGRVVREDDRPRRDGRSLDAQLIKLRGHTIDSRGGDVHRTFSKEATPSASPESSGRPLARVKHPVLFLEGIKLSLSLLGNGDDAGLGRARDVLNVEPECLKASTSVVSERIHTDADLIRKSDYLIAERPIHLSRGSSCSTGVGDRVANAGHLVGHRIESVRGGECILFGVPHRIAQATSASTDSLEVLAESAHSRDNRSDLSELLDEPANRLDDRTRPGDDFTLHRGPSADRRSTTAEEALAHVDSQCGDARERGDDLRLMVLNVRGKVLNSGPESLRERYLDSLRTYLNRALSTLDSGSRIVTHRLRCASGRTFDLTELHCSC